MRRKRHHAAQSTCSTQTHANTHGLVYYLLVLDNPLFGGSIRRPSVGPCGRRPTAISWSFMIHTSNYYIIQQVIVLPTLDNATIFGKQYIYFACVDYLKKGCYKLSKSLSRSPPGPSIYRTVYFRMVCSSPGGI